MFAFALAFWFAAAPLAGVAADRVAPAEALLADLEYAQARELLLELLADDTLTPDERARAHLLAGVTNRVLDRDVDAALHFRRALEINPDATLEPGHPPKITAFFDMVRADVVKPDVVKPDVVKPDVVEPVVIEPDVVEPDVVKPEVVPPAEIAPAPPAASISTARYVSYAGWSVAGLGALGIGVNGAATVGLLAFAFTEGAEDPERFVYSTLLSLGTMGAAVLCVLPTLVGLVVGTVALGLDLTDDE